MMPETEYGPIVAKALRHAKVRAQIEVLEEEKITIAEWRKAKLVLLRKELEK